MATRTSAELGADFGDPTEDGLDDFEPEPGADRGVSWQRVTDPSAVDMLRWDPYLTPTAPRRWWVMVMPVLAVLVIAAAVVSWIGLGAEDDAAAPAPRRSASAPAPAPSDSLVTDSLTPAAVPPAAVPPAVRPAPVPAVPAPSPAPPPAAAVPPPAVGAPAAAGPAATRALAPDVEATLAAIGRSYRELDASGLSAVWPGADTASLAQSFSEFKYQSLSFDRCTSRPNGAESVVTSCDVSITAAPKTGDPPLQRRRESWTLVLNRTGDRWTVAGVTVR